jgi:hypothetical protein
MRQSSVLFVVLGAVGLAGFLSACSGGGSPSASASAGGASGSGSASASGTVTGFGSIIVNGKRFETEGAFVSVDGQPSSQCTVSPANRCGLQEGMTVKVSGSFNGSTNRAASIAQEDTLEGPITNVDAANSQFAVLGQTVLVDDTTKFDSGLNLAALVVGNVVEVSGFVKSDGVVAASFIERKPGTGCSPVCEVKGTVRNHNAVLATFQIGGLTVIYDSNTSISDMPVPSGSNWNGLFVEVKGATLSGSTLTATKVEPENDGVGNGQVDKFEVEGFVTQVGTPNGNVIGFTIGTTSVQTTASTEFRGGTVDEIVLGAKMSAEGRFDGTTLIAQHVKFHESVRLEGNATVTGNTLTLAGLPGVTITANSQTELKNAASLNDLNGNHVRVRGRVTGTNTVIATRIELRSSDPDVDLQGPVQSINGTVIEILGVSVDLANINQFESVRGSSMSRAAFLADVAVNSLVKVKGRLSGITVIWDEAELED